MEALMFTQIMVRRGRKQELLPLVAERTEEEQGPEAGSWPVQLYHEATLVEASGIRVP